MSLELDGVPMNDIQLNGTTCINGVTPKDSKNMGGGDHQLVGRVFQLTVGFFSVDYLE